MQTQTQHQRFPCAATRQIVTIRRVYEVGSGIGGVQAAPELLIEQCSQEMACPKFDQCPLRTG